MAFQLRFYFVLWKVISDIRHFERLMADKKWNTAENNMLNASSLLFIRNMHDWYSKTKQQKKSDAAWILKKKESGTCTAHSSMLKTMFCNYTINVITWTIPN